MIVVVGAGVTGLASARALAQRGHAVTVLERHPRPGLGASTRNSGVIHAGLYHPADSLKTRLCVEGRERLYAFAEAHRVPFVRCGKLIVAQAGEEARLEAVRQSAAANGVLVEAVDRAFVAAREPHVSAVAALWSPHTGWLDADAYVRALVAELARHDGVLLVGTPLVAIEPGPSRLTVVTPAERIEADTVVNAAGLYADEVSAMAGGEPFTIHPCRGEYAELVPRARYLVNGLVYPVPHASGHGLGAHLTKTRGGAVWIGPTIRYQDGKDDYERDRLPAEAFLDPARTMLPALAREDLRLGGSGIRAKIHPESVRYADFLIRRDSRNPYLVHAAGIESPGLTASLAVGELVSELVTSAVRS
jgi:L-2-hydroxyglutarate oxidase LhgO